MIVLQSLYRGIITVRPRVPMRDIIALVADRYGLTEAELKGPDRTFRVAHPRQEAMFLCRQQGWSSGQIAMALGGRDHSTVIHGCQAHARRMAEGRGLAA